MTNPVFPTLSQGQDSKLYGIELEDTALKTQMDGGYVVSRAKHTRRPRRSFKTGFTFIPSADKLLLEGFYDSVRGGSVIFDWTDPSTKVVYQVRFAEKLSFAYEGVGSNQKWSVSISLDQA